MQFQFDEKRVALNVNLPHDPILVLADEDRALQVLTNLLGNALQYTPQSGTVTVTIEREKSSRNSPSAIRALAFPPNTSRTSSTASTAWTNPARARTAAQALG
jgi:signal transduction histidine kinase